MYKAESELTYDDWRVIHAYRNCRALMRRKALSRPMRERLPGDLARLEAEAAERRIDPALLRVWRAYPQRDENGDLSFGFGVDFRSGQGEVVLSPPPKRRVRPRRDRDRNGSNGAPTLSAGDLLAALEHELAQRMNLAPSGERR
jgi:hypothetical protein